MFGELFTDHPMKPVLKIFTIHKSDIKARGGSRFLGHILPQSNFHVKIIFELLTCPCKQFIKLAVHVCRIAEINLQMS